LLQEHNDASSYSGLTMVKDFLLGSEEIMMDFFPQKNHYQETKEDEQNKSRKAQK